MATRLGAVDDLANLGRNGTKLGRIASDAPPTSPRLYGAPDAAVLPAERTALGPGRYSPFRDDWAPATTPLQAPPPSRGVSTGLREHGGPPSAYGDLEAQLAYDAQRAAPASDVASGDRLMRRAGQSSESEIAVAQDFLRTAPEGGTVPASRVDPSLRDDAFARRFDAGEEPLTTKSAIGKDPAVESVQEAIAVGRRLGYSDADIAAYIRKNYDLPGASGDRLMRRAGEQGDELLPNELALRRQQAPGYADRPMLQESYGDAEVWYHGTGPDFAGFAAAPTRTTDDFNSLLGIHFTEDRTVAQRFADGLYSDKAGGRVIDARLSITNPKVYAFEGELADDVVRVAIDEGIIRPGDLPEPWRGLNDRGTEILKGAGDKRTAIADAFRAHLRASGHDGVIYGNVVEGSFGNRTAIAFDAGQVRLADDAAAIAPTGDDVLQLRHGQDTPIERLAGTVRQGRFTPDPGVRQRFRAALDDAATAHPHGAAVDVKDASFYSDPTTRLYLSEDGRTGVAVAADGELVSVFRHPESPGVVDDLLRVASKEASYLSAFDSPGGKLPTLYGKQGFKPVARVRFDREFAPPGWDFARSGDPDVVLMVRDPDNTLGLPRITKGRGYDDAVREQVPVMTYVEAEDAVEAALSRLGDAPGNLTATRIRTQTRPSVKQALADYEAGTGGADWYLGVPEELSAMGIPDSRVGIATDVYASLSQVASPVNQTNEFLRVWPMLESGVHPDDITGLLDDVRKNIKRALAGEPLSGNKIKDMAWAMRGNTDRPVIDRHIARWATNGKKESLSPKQYEAVSELIIRMANEAGVTPVEMQASIWKTIRAEGNQMADMGENLAETLQRLAAEKGVELGPPPTAARQAARTPGGALPAEGDLAGQLAREQQAAREAGDLGSGGLTDIPQERAPFTAVDDAAPPRDVAPTAGAAPEPTEPNPNAALRELLGGSDVEPGLSSKDRLLNSLKRVIGGTEAEEFATPVMKSRRELLRVNSKLANRLGAATTARVTSVFDIDDVGRIQSLPGAPTVQDVAARLPEFEGSLTPEQLQVMRWLEDEVKLYNAALVEQGVEFGSRTDVVEGGYYLPRGRAGIEGADDPMKVRAGGGKVGGRRGFEKHAVFDSMAEGIDAGYSYAPLGEAMKTYANDAGQRALDQHTSGLFKSVTDEAGELVGESPHVRLLQQNGDLATSVEGLRKRVQSLKNNIAGLTKRQSEVLERFSTAPGPDLDELLEAFTELRKRPMKTGRGDMTVREAQTALIDAKADLDGILPAWRKALDKARQTPRDQGQIGFYQLQGTSFPDAMANAANKFLKEETPASGPLAGVVNVVEAVNGLLRSVRATADASFLGIQGLLGLGHSPQTYGGALKVAVRSISDPEVLGKFVLAFDDAATAAGRPTSREWIKAGLHMGGSETEFTIGTGLGRVGDWIQSRPGIKEANRSFGYFGDSQRLGLADTMWKEGRPLEEIAEAANLATGWSKGRFLGEVGGLVQFAPRFFQSQLDMVVNAMTKGGREGVEARKMLIKLMGYGTLITVAANEALGNKHDYLTPFRDKDGKLTSNPLEAEGLNSNFMRIRIGGELNVAGVDVWKGQDVSLFGTWDSLLRGVIAAGQGDVGYIARSKAAPIISTAWDAFSGKTFMGEDYDVEEFLRSLLPFTFSDVGREAVGHTVVNSSGVKASDVTQYEKRKDVREDVANELYPDAGGYDSLNDAQQRKVNDDARVVEATRLAEEGALDQDWAEGLRKDIADEGRVQTFKDTGMVGEDQIMQEGINEYDEAFLDGSIDLDTWLDFDKTYRNTLAGMKAEQRALDEPFDYTESDLPVDVAIRAYFDLGPAGYYNEETKEMDWKGYLAERDELRTAAVKAGRGAGGARGAQDVEDYLTFADDRPVKAQQDAAWDIIDAAPPQYEGVSAAEEETYRDYTSRVYEVHEAMGADASIPVVSRRYVAEVLAEDYGGDSTFDLWDRLSGKGWEDAQNPAYWDHIGRNLPSLELWMPGLMDSQREREMLGIEQATFDEDQGRQPPEREAPDRGPARDAPERLTRAEQDAKSRQLQAIRDWLSSH